MTKRAEPQQPSTIARAAAFAGAIALLSAALCGCHPGLADANKEALLWPEGAPRARGHLPRDRPRLYYFVAPKSVRTGVAAVVAAGGSYGHQLGLSSEGVEVARWLAANGITAVVVRYRVGGTSGYNHVDFFADGQRAVRTVRAQASQLGVDPDRIGMIGFSAGGHLASWVATQCAEDEGRPEAEDPIERVSCRIAFSVLVYPVITLDDRYAHRRSRRNLVGWTNSASPELVRRLSTDTQVTSTTPPAFLVHSRRDRKVDVQNSVLFYEALRSHGVPAELLLADDGSHGVGLADDPEHMPQMAAWPQRCLQWLEKMDVLEDDDRIGRAAAGSQLSSGP